MLRIVSFGLRPHRAHDRFFQSVLLPLWTFQEVSVSLIIRHTLASVLGTYDEVGGSIRPS